MSCSVLDCGENVANPKWLGWNFVPAPQVSTPLQSGCHGIVGDQPCIPLLVHGRSDSSGRSVPGDESVTLLPLPLAVTEFSYADSKLT